MRQFRFEAALDARLSDGPQDGFGLGDDIDLTDPAIYREVCLSGWDEIEAAGAWNLGEIAVLSIPLAEPIAAAAVVWVEGDAFATDRHSQVVSVLCDGVRLRPVCLRPPAAKLLRIAWPPDRPVAGGLRLALEFVDLVSPASLGVGPDERRLGLMARRVVVTGPNAPRPHWLSGEVVPVGAPAA